eukprot:TRINITY_DN1424_c0_g4_i1.p2 TRINITY_DN1424_c0_g4~~TRINITY_DN1424_c0_g4_i1.p2  ORF type:complete len:206 (-),score=41.46 TRINITY_DN1424_c0_g4_i1:368-985(-)
MFLRPYAQIFQNVAGIVGHRSTSLNTTLLRAAQTSIALTRPMHTSTARLTDNDNRNNAAESNAAEMSEAEAYVRRVCPEYAPSNTPISPRRDIFAVIEMGPHQYKVTNGDVLHTEKVPHDIGRSFDVDKVLLIGTKTETVIGQPYIPDAKVTVTVEEQARSETVLVLKKKRRKNYQRRNGHRQFYSVLRINNIQFTPSQAPEEDS